MWFDSVTTLKLWWKNWRTLPVWSWVKAAAFYRKGDYVQAELYYRKGMASHPNHPAQFAAQLDLAFCQFKNGKFSEAEGSLEAVLEARTDVLEGFLRLARLQLWTGRPLSAAWTLRRASRQLSASPELAALFVIAALESRGPQFIIVEALHYFHHVGTTTNEVGTDDTVALLFKTAEALISRSRGDTSRSKTALQEISSSNKPPVEALVFFARALMEDGECEAAREVLRRALRASPNHPHVLLALARTYLQETGVDSISYALQLSTAACQNSGWMSAQALHILAEAHLADGSVVDAVLVAQKAREEGGKLLGNYHGLDQVERLIEDLSSAMPSNSVTFS